MIDDENIFAVFIAMKNAANEERIITAMIIPRVWIVNELEISEIAAAAPVLALSIEYKVMNERARTSIFTFPRSIRNRLPEFSLSSSWNVEPIIAA